MKLWLAVMALIAAYLVGGLWFSWHLWGLADAGYGDGYFWSQVVACKVIAFGAFSAVLMWADRPEFRRPRPLLMDGVWYIQAAGLWAFALSTMGVSVYFLIVDEFHGLGLPLAAWIVGALAVSLSWIMLADRWPTLYRERRDAWLNRRTRELVDAEIRREKAAGLR